LNKSKSTEILQFAKEPRIALNVRVGMVYRIMFKVSS